MRFGKMGIMGRALVVTAFASTALFMGANMAVAGISTTKHNLGSTGSGTNSFDGTAAICVFCHTPHGANLNAVVPLWNRKLNTPSNYTTYDSLGTSSLDGGVEKVGSVSIACLSCHDGTQAMNVMINAPGSGNYDPANGFTLPGTWSGPAARSPTTVGSLDYATASIVNIGTDLTNDHPIGIQYGGGGVTVTSQPTDGQYTGNLGDSDFHKPWKKTINGNPVWWVDTGTGGLGTRQKTDMQLYTRTGTVGGVTGSLGDQPYVECASCHNPHESANPTFLRIANTGSAVCLACHVK